MAEEAKRAEGMRDAYLALQRKPVRSGGVIGDLGPVSPLSEAQIEKLVDPGPRLSGARMREATNDGYAERIVTGGDEGVTVERVAVPKRERRKADNTDLA